MNRGLQHPRSRAERRQHPFDVFSAVRDHEHRRERAHMAQGARRLVVTRVAGPCMTRPMVVLCGRYKLRRSGGRPEHRRLRSRPSRQVCRVVSSIRSWSAGNVAQPACTDPGSPLRGHRRGSVEDNDVRRRPAPRAGERLRRRSERLPSSRAMTLTDRDLNWDTEHGARFGSRSSRVRIRSAFGGSRVEDKKPRQHGSGAGVTLIV
jgi:hypothetical protein